jgi:hypothetical protein
VEVAAKARSGQISDLSGSTSQSLRPALFSCFSLSPSHVRDDDLNCPMI